MLSYDTIEFILGCDETEDNSRSQKNKIIKEVEYMTELRDKSVLHEAQAHIEAYKRGEEWAKKDVFDNVDDLMDDLMKEWDTAKRLLAMGLSPQQVVDGTMLPLEEVEKMVDEIKNK